MDFPDAHRTERGVHAGQARDIFEDEVLKLRGVGAASSRLRRALKLNSASAAAIGMPSQLESA